MTSSIMKAFLVRCSAMVLLCGVAAFVLWYPSAWSMSTRLRLNSLLPYSQSLPHYASSPEPHQPATSDISALLVGQSLESHVLTSASGQYTFELDQNGELRLQDIRNNLTLFSSGTGIEWHANWHVELQESGELALSWSRPTTPPVRGLYWTSARLPGCQDPGPADSTQLPVLELLDSSLLQIRRGRRVTCVLHAPEPQPKEEEVEISNKKSAAVKLKAILTQKLSALRLRVFRASVTRCETHVTAVYSRWTKILNIFRWRRCERRTYFAVRADRVRLAAARAGK